MDFYSYLSDIFSEDVQEDSILKSFESYDSYSLLEIISMVETYYGKSINGNDIRKYNTAKELYDYVVSLPKEK